MSGYIPFKFDGFADLVLAFAVLALIVALRYVAICGIAEIIFYRWQPQRLAGRRTLKAYPTPRERGFEFYQSLVTCLIFAVSGLLMGWMWQYGYARFYLDVSTFGLCYVPLSWILYALIHDAIYYWLHRAMHRPLLYKKMHGTHHRSLRPSAWASFSFHPWESVAQALILPILLLFIPIHPGVFLLHLSFMTITAVSNHTGYELLPRGRVGRWLASWLISGAHHTLHHRHGWSNYGLFFTWWDHHGRTEHPQFGNECDRLFRECLNLRHSSP